MGQEAQGIAREPRRARRLGRGGHELPAARAALEARLGPPAHREPRAVQVVVDEHADDHRRIALEVVLERGFQEQRDLVEPVPGDAVVQDAVRAAELARFQVVLEARAARRGAGRVGVAVEQHRPPLAGGGRVDQPELPRREAQPEPAVARVVVRHGAQVGRVEGGLQDPVEVLGRMGQPLGQAHAARHIGAAERGGEQHQAHEPLEQQRGGEQRDRERRELVPRAPERRAAAQPRTLDPHALKIRVEVYPGYWREDSPMNLGDLGNPATGAFRALGRVLGIAGSWACLWLAIWLIAGMTIRNRRSRRHRSGRAGAMVREDRIDGAAVGIVFGIALSVGSNRQRRAE